MLTRLPRPATAVLGALKFRNSDRTALTSLNDAEWRHALAFTERTQTTLLLGTTCPSSLPPAISERILADHRRNLARLSALRGYLFEILDALEGGEVPYVLFKGFTHGPAYGPSPDVRPNYDIDLYAPPDSLAPAHAAILNLGYEPVPGMEDFPTDHLPVMVRKTGWQWRGDCYDPEIPPSVDLHFRFWDRETERIACPGVEEFWERRTRDNIGGREAGVLHPVDKLGYAALHALRHLLRGNTRPYQIYEIAYFLEQSSGDAAFWDCWAKLHPTELRRLESIVFELARCWFDCALPPVLTPLPPRVRLWMDRYAGAPLEALFRPNKSELWLHLSLLESIEDQRAVVWRKILPSRLPGPVDGIYVPERELTRRLRLRRCWRYVLHALGRAFHHLRTFPPLLREGIDWWRLAGSPGKPLLLFLLAANTFGFGVTVFVLLYNLLLLDYGYREDLLGLANGAMTVGSFAGALVAPSFTRRIGLRKTLFAACLSAPFLFAARALFLGRGSVLASAFLSGLGLSWWMTALPPSVAALTTERSRPLGFSLWVGSGIATGITAGLIGSRLPVWLGSKQAAILSGCAVSLLSLTLLARLRMPEAATAPRAVYPWNRFLVRYLFALAVWSIAIGAFNPFFNAFFSRRLGASVAQIGSIYSTSQFVQVLATVAAPGVLRRWGLAGGTAAMQVGTAGALIALAMAPSIIAGAAVYTVFMSLQVMCEPGVFSLPMSRMKPEERVGASGLMFLVMFASQALAAAAAGWGFAHVGYPAVMTSAALLAVAAALLFARTL